MCLRMLQEITADMECSIHIKSFQIDYPRLRMFPLFENTFTQGLLAPYTPTGESFTVGKVYIDKNDYGIKTYNGEYYKTGYHAQRIELPLFIRYKMVCSNLSRLHHVKYPVMLADITGRDEDQICGRVMMILTEKDYNFLQKYYYYKPINLEGSAPEVEQEAELASINHRG